MKAIWLAAVGFCASGVGLAQAPKSAPLTESPQQKTHPNRWSCLLGSDCLGVSKIPVTACRVTGKDANAKDSCAVDGMKLIGKFSV